MIRRASSGIRGRIQVARQTGRDRLGLGGSMSGIGVHQAEKIQTPQLYP